MSEPKVHFVEFSKPDSEGRRTISLFDENKLLIAKHTFPARLAAGFLQLKLDNLAKLGFENVVEH